MLKLVAHTKMRFPDIQMKMDADENRKKSVNMVLASEIVKDLWRKLPSDLDLSSLNIIFCSGEGELQQTFEYFRNLAQDRARPILFQNSLHNSTLGSLSLELPGITSGITVSNGELSFESAVDMALSSPSPFPFLIVGVDAYNEELKKVRSHVYKGKVELTTGGCAAFFIPSTHPKFRELKGKIISDIKFSSADTKDVFTDYYPAGGMESIAKVLELTGKKEYEKPGHHKVTIITDEN